MIQLKEALIGRHNIDKSGTKDDIDNYILIPLGTQVSRFLSRFFPDQLVEDEVGAKYIFQPEEDIKSWAKELPSWVKKCLTVMSWKVKEVKTVKDALNELHTDAFKLLSKCVQYNDLNI